MLLSLKTPRQKLPLGSRAHGKKDQSLMACSRTHMSQLGYQFTGRDMPMQKLGGWLFCCPYRNVGFPEYNLTQGNQLCKVTGQN